jgi:large subunit ribosomal protein L18
MDAKLKQEKRDRRHKRVRAKVSGTSKVPRFCVFRSNKHIYGQLIDDEKGKTIMSASDTDLPKLKQKKPSPAKSGTADGKEKKIERKAKIAKAYEVGKMIAKKALEKKIKKVVFDRGGYKYHGRVKAVAEGARDAGLVF